MTLETGVKICANGKPEGPDQQPGR